MQKIEICILAGGLSTRMGRDKSRLRLGQKSLLGHIRSIAKQPGVPVRVIRRDLIQRCGPLGGVFTALKTTRADAVLFLACDMPFVSGDFLRRMLKRFEKRESAFFATNGGPAGFPFILPRRMLAEVEENLAGKKFPLQALAEVCRARLIRAGRKQLLNVNTPEEWAFACKLFGKKQ
jgi:molybdopterin-guanine dinucleotide biosynthesis protein A